MPSHNVLQNLVSTIPRSKHTAAYRLFHYHRRVMVQQLFTMNVKVMAEIGVSTTGDPKIDQQLRSEWVTISLTGVEMTQFMQKGAAMMFEEHKTPTAVYLDCVEHLRGWLDLFDKNPNLRRAPLNDLKLFDDLAGAVFPYASRQLMPNEDDAGYGAFLARAARRRRGLAAELINSQTDDMPVKLSYKPISEQVAERLARRLGK